MGKPDDAAVDVYGERFIQSILEDEDGNVDLVAWARFTVNRLGRIPDYDHPEADPAGVFAYCLLLARAPDEVKAIAAREGLGNQAYIAAVQQPEAAIPEVAQPRFTDEERTALEIVLEHCAGYLNARTIVRKMLENDR